MVTDAELEPPGPRIVYVNPAFERMTQYRAEELRGRTPRLLQGPRTSRQTLDELKRCLRAERCFEGATVTYRKDGTAYVAHWYVEPLRDEADRVTHYLAVQRNVGAERSAQDRAQMLARALEQQRDGALVLDRAGRVEYVNAAFESLSGMTAAELAGHRIWDSGFLPTITRRAVIRRALLRPPHAWSGELQLTLPRDLLDVEVSIAALQDEGHIRGFVASVRDVSERRRVQAISAALNLSDNLGYIISGIRHELGNPINSIKAALSVVRRNLQRFDTAKIESYLDGTLEEVERVEYLLRSLRSYNALETQAPSPVALPAFFAGFERLVRRDFERRDIHLTVECERGLTAVGDERALHQVLLNLLTNAADALPEAGPRTIRVVAQRRRGSIHVEVVDTGHGIPSEQLERLFQPFSTFKPGGTGMGLVISRRLLAKMRGTIAIESEVGRGTRVTVQLEEAE